MPSRLAVVALVLAGCYTHAPPVVQVHQAGVASAQPARLALGELELQLGDKRVIHVHADGTIESDGKPPLVVTADGRIAIGAHTLFALQADGSIHDRDGKRVEWLHLDHAGLLTNGNKKLSIDRDGRVLGVRSADVRVIGANGPRLRRTAMLVLVAASLSCVQSAPDEVAASVAFPAT